MVLLAVIVSLFASGLSDSGLNVPFAKSIYLDKYSLLSILQKIFVLSSLNSR